MPGAVARRCPRYRGQPASLRTLVLEAGRKTCRQVTWRHGSKRPGTSSDATAAAARLWRLGAGMAGLPSI